MIDSERTVELHKAISEHLNAYGPKGWSRVRKLFPDVPTATFWRHVRLVRDQMASADGRRDRSGIGTVSNDNPLGNQIPWEKQRETSQFTSLTEFYEGLRQVARYKQLVLDAENLAKQCVDRRGHIFRPSIYLKSIALRQKLLEQELDAMEAFYDVERMTKFYDYIIQTVEQLPSGATQEDGLKALKGVQDEFAQQAPTRADTAVSQKR